MSISRNREDARADIPELTPDDLLQLGRIIGWQRWGMIVLYYHAGLSQADIGRILGVRRQMVAYEMRRGFELAAEHFKRRRLCSPKRPRGGRRRRATPPETS